MVNNIRINIKIVDKFMVDRLLWLNIARFGNVFRAWREEGGQRVLRELWALAQS
jgi:hypothetical protein